VADFFKALLVVNILILVTFAVSTALVLRKLTRANRVAPGRRSAAPLSWLVSPFTAPRLHRRLRRAVAAARLSVAVAPAALALQDVAGELTARAVKIDDYLVAANGLHPQVRRPRLYELADEIREIEESTGRLHRLSSDWCRQLDLATATMGVALPDLHQRLDAVEAALRELPATAPLAH